MFSALAAVCTVDCAIEIVFITLHYITFGSFMEPFQYSLGATFLARPVYRRVLGAGVGFGGQNVDVARQLHMHMPQRF